MSKRKNKKKKYHLLILPILLLVALFCLLIFYIKSITVKEDRELSTKFEDSSVVTLKSILPISDKLGRNLDGKGTEDGVQGYVEFSIRNNLDKDVKYQIYIIPREVEKEIKGNYIKFYLTDNINNPVAGYEKNLLPTFNEFPVIVDKPEARLLYTDKIKVNEKKKFVLRSWLSDSFGISDRDLEFSYKVGVKIK